MTSDARQQLVRFLESRAFKPVMSASPRGRSDADKRKLQHVQKATEAEMERFRGYGSAHEVVENFRRDLNSQPAKKIHAELKALELPVINDLEDEFEKKADELGVG